ncbi:hypothetical protein BZA05DRAFT_442518 [Tricharina praecox]|uniref:uncharacterized protein n=1 Tax=Tricharina praecox TaxID=43433 RepID=UPI00221FA6C2|nr:uncharacterized protein BZA05DRAFT_442518 [Tricharina praecox]KAI5855837.1 hypothetical protein BZA05DRAFT_442518 [Tricharina praecox]
MSGPPPEVRAKNQEWESKFKGKDMTAAEMKAELPPVHRVVKPGMMMTRDFVENRVNVHVDEKGVCTHCTHG